MATPGMRPSNVTRQSKTYRNITFESEDDLVELSPFDQMSSETL
jgi:hypothetical protein